MQLVKIIIPTSSLTHPQSMCLGLLMWHKSRDTNKVIQYGRFMDILGNVAEFSQLPGLILSHYAALIISAVSWLCFFFACIRMRTTAFSFER